MKNLQDINSDIAEELRECASDLFFEFMVELEGTELYNKYIIDHGKEYEGYNTSSTELGSELFYRIEDRLFKLKLTDVKK